MRVLKFTLWIQIFMVMMLFCTYTAELKANTHLSLLSVDFKELLGNKRKLTLLMSDKATTPKVFHTDKPARIILDFEGVKSELAHKKNMLNASEVSGFFVVEAAGKLRFVLNLEVLLAYEVEVNNKEVVITLMPNENTDAEAVVSLTDKSLKTFVSGVPEQRISKIDFRRGKKGEGRLLISLLNPNTVVTTTEKAGKIELSFLNTKLPEKYAKTIDVIDFATPVSLIEAKSLGTAVKIWLTPLKGDYTYSAFQSDGLFTLEVQPSNNTDTVEKQRRKFPYIGERLSLNFHDIEIRSVLQILADFTNINIIANDSIDGNITLRLNDVPWDQAFEFILKVKGLGQRQTGNVILVAPIAEINKLEEDEIKALKISQRLEPLRTEYMQINYAKAENFRAILLGTSALSASGCSVSENSAGGGGPTPSAVDENTGNYGRSQEEDNYSLLSKRGTAIVDSRTNTLIVKDTSKSLEEIRRMLLILDRPVRQVLIEARIVIAEEGFAKDLGAKFGATYRGGDGVSTGINMSGTTGGIVDDVVTPLLSNLAVANPYGALGMTLASGADYVLNLEISAMQNDRKAEFISNPRVLTSDRCKATIEQGEEIPFQTTSQEGTTTIFKDAKIILEVTPQITPSGSVIMSLKITKDGRGTQTPDGLAINKREINTNVHIENGETVVLGGVYETDKENIVNKVPWFADLPMIGWIFKKELNNHFKKELLIFITPKIMKNSMKIQ